VRERTRCPERQGANDEHAQVERDPARGSPRCSLDEFAETGLHGASTEDIARRAGISQPYVFRLFTTKKELFTAVAARCFRETLELFERAAEGKRGREALDAIGTAYAERLWDDPRRLQVQMQAYAACSDPEICAVVRNGVGDLVTHVERVGGLPDEETARFFAIGMLMNLIASMHLAQGMEPWADRLVAGCGSHLPPMPVPSS
jgi:AcrR family transcriptional regulator